MIIKMIATICTISLCSEFAYGQSHQQMICDSLKSAIDGTRRRLMSGEITMDDVFAPGSMWACAFENGVSINPGCAPQFEGSQQYCGNIRRLQISEFTTPTRNRAKPASNASQQPAPQNRTTTLPPSQPQPTAIKGGNRNKCIKHAKEKEQYGYNFTNNCNETVYVEIVRGTDGGLYHFTLKPGETARHFWGGGKSKFRACKGSDSMALDTCGG